MNRTKLILIGILLALAVVLGLLMLRSAPTGNPTVVTPPSTHEIRSDLKRQAPSTHDLTPRSDSRPVSRKHAQGLNESAKSGSETESMARDAAMPETKTLAEQAVEAWETLVDQVIGQKEAPTDEQAQRVKKIFDTLDKEDQMDGIHRALNLVPDEQFPVLIAILYDKTEDPDVLDAIFSDALNRPEELKNPIMKKLRKDPTHPMFFESARILDVVEPEEEKELEQPAGVPL